MTQEISTIAKPCEKQLLTIASLQNELSTDEYFADCLRLCQRVLVFIPLVEKVMAKEEALINLLRAPKKQNELKFLLETLEMVKGFIVNHKDRITYKGTTEPTALNLYLNDIAKLNHRVSRLSESFSLSSAIDEQSFVERRKEDLKVSSAYFLFSYFA